MFPGMSEGELIAAAIPCLVFASSWLPIWLDQRRRSRDRRQEQVEQLDDLRVRLQEDIAPWAGNVWDENSHSPDWYNPSVGVRAFDWSFVQRFNRVVLTGDYRPELRAGLVRLEELAKSFHERMKSQIEFLRKAPADIALRWPAVVEASKTKGSPLSPEGMAEIAGLTDDDRKYLTDLYALNKKLHVAGIGGPGQGGLYEAWSTATTQLDAVQERLRARADPQWYRLGHVISGAFALAGLLFAGDFWLSVVDAKHHVASTTTPATGVEVSGAANSRTDTAHVAPSDSQSAGRGAASPAPDQRELWSLDHPARISCAVSTAQDQDTLVVMNSGYPVKRFKVDRLVFFDVQPYATPGDVKFLRYVVGDYYGDQLDGDYEDSQRLTYGHAAPPGNLPLIRLVTVGLVDSLTGRGLKWTGILVRRAIRVVYWDKVGKMMEAHYWGSNAADQPPRQMDPISRRRWQSLVAAADSTRKSGRTLTCGTKTGDADVRRVVRDCIEAIRR